MLLDPGSLFFSILFSVIGIGYFSYGKKHNLYFMLSGVALFIFPYFVTQMVWLIIVGLIFTLLPFILQWLMPID